MSADNIAISVRNLTKTYRLFGHPGDRIKQFFSLGLKQYHREFTALKDVSFDIKKGETVGIIGRNGSGKSTLLQLVCGILKPTAGTVQVNGRVSALLELGAGFNPEFTGRENVYFQGALMGFTQSQMEVRFDDIAAFADIGEFIDQPVRTYSSGMFVRLAFAVATHVQPDLLVVDEALSVGDSFFQHKSRILIDKLISSGATLLLVSHDRAMITATCSRCVMLDHGAMKLDGLSTEVFGHYQATIIAHSGMDVTSQRLSSGHMQVATHNDSACVELIQLLEKDNRPIASVVVGQGVVLEFSVFAQEPIAELVLGFAIRDRFGHTVFNTNSDCFGMSPKNTAIGSQHRFRFSLQINIGPGSYSISYFLSKKEADGNKACDYRELAFHFDVANPDFPYFLGSAWLAPKLVVDSYPASE
jgi:lipopolysaccharide transport system ATP-binding protein